jgi:actin-related protein 3
MQSLGFAGNDSPSFVFPTAIATKAGAGATKPPVANKPGFLSAGGGASSHLSAKRGTEDLDFFIGDEALAAANGPGYAVNYPIRHGQIENWDHMERFWSNSIFKYLRVEPEDHYFLLTEPVRHWFRSFLLKLGFTVGGITYANMYLLHSP